MHKIFKNNLTKYLLLLTVLECVLVWWMAYDLNKVDDFWINDFVISPVKPPALIKIFPPHDKMGVIL